MHNSYRDASDAAAAPVEGAAWEAPPTVVIAGGNGPMRSTLRILLEDDGCTVVESGGLGDEMAQARDVALMVLVASEREGDVRESLSRIARLQHRPRVLLVVTGEQRALRAYGLDHGADVVRVPIGMRDLQNRLRLILGHHEGAQTPFAPMGAVRAGGLTLWTASCVVGDDTGWSVRLTRRETALLKILMQAPGQVVRQQDLLRSVWAGRLTGSRNAATVLVGRLRVKLAGSRPGSGALRTIYGHGYAFEARQEPRDVECGAPNCLPDVLVVDDDEATVDVVAEVLQSAGYTVARGVGRLTPSLARRILPKVILLDINMPEMDGIAIRRHLHAAPQTSRIPVIACSAAHNLRSHAAEMAADDFLTKPFSPDELLLRVEKWVGPAPVVSGEW